MIACFFLVSSLWSGALASSEVEKAEARRFALIVSSEDSPETSELATVLRDEYGFSVMQRFGPTATSKGIEEAMGQLYDQIQYFDQLFMHVSLPVLRTPQLSYLPTGAIPEESWQHLSWRHLAEWLNALPTGAVLMTYPGCASQTRSPYGDPQLEELAYSKRPGPAEILLVCDREAMRMKRRDPEFGITEWRGTELAGIVAQVLNEATQSDSGGTIDTRSIESTALVQRVNNFKLEGFSVDLVTIPLHEQPVFRFAPIFAGNEYEDRYSHALNYEVLFDVQQSYLAASGNGDALMLAFIRFSRRIAVDPKAIVAEGNDLDSRDILQLRRNAVSALSRIGARELAARDEMIKVAAGAVDSSLIRRAAVSALSRWSTEARPNDIQALRTALQDGDPSVRETAVVGVIQAEGEAAVPLIKSLILTESDARVKRTMIEGLASFRRTEDSSLFLSLLKDPDATIRRQSVHALASLKPEPAVNEAVLHILGSDPDEAVRTAAAYALTDTFVPGQNQRNVEALITTLRADEQERTRVAAAKSLGIIGGSDAELALREALTADQSLLLQITCAEALGVMKSTDAIPELARASRSDEPTLRLAAVYALGRLATQAAAEVLWERIEYDEDQRIRDEASTAIRGIEIELSLVRDRMNSDSKLVRQAAVSQLAGSSDGDVLQFLIEGLGDSDTDVQLAAIEGLVASTNPGLINAVIEVFETTDNTQIQANGIKILGMLENYDDPRILEVVTGATQSQNAQVRAEAVYALGGWHDDETVLQIVLAASKDNSAQVRLAAARALGKFSQEEAQWRLQEMALQPTSFDAQRAAIEALSPKINYKKN